MVNRGSRIKYCGECEDWISSADEFRINKTHAADNRDITIPCPNFYGNGEKLGLYSEPLCPAVSVKNKSYI